MLDKLRNRAVSALIFLFLGSVPYLFCCPKKLDVPERLVYNVSWKFLKVGYGTLEVIGLTEFNATKAYHIHSTARSSSFFDNFFKVRDSNDSYIDAEYFRSLCFKQQIREGRYKRDKNIVFDHSNMTATNHKNEIFPIPENALDVLAALYWIREQNLTTGISFHIPVNSGKKSFNMEVRVTGKEKIKISGKKYSTVIVEPMLQDAGIFLSKGYLKIWMTDDDAHIPVKMQSEIAVGSIVAELDTEK